MYKKYGNRYSITISFCIEIDFGVGVIFICCGELVYIARGFFFFQAEDGIRDGTVTGVQTCVLPILGRGGRIQPWPAACRDVDAGRDGLPGPDRRSALGVRSRAFARTSIGTGSRAG